MVKTELKSDIQALKVGIAQLENRLTLRMGAMAAFILAAMGAMKFFA